MTWDRRLYFPSEGRRAEDFFALKNPTASAGFEPANFGTKGQHATPRPPYFTALYRALASSRTRLLDHTQRRATFGRTALNE